MKAIRRNIVLTEIGESIDMQASNNRVVGIPFVSHVDQKAEPFIDNPKEYLKEIYQTTTHSQLYNLHSTGAVKIMGYRYSFKKYLKQYVVKQHGEWHEYYAPNKTMLRKSIYGTVDKIIEI